MLTYSKHPTCLAGRTLGSVSFTLVSLHILIKTDSAHTSPTQESGFTLSSDLWMSLLCPESINRTDFLRFKSCKIYSAELPSGSCRHWVWWVPGLWLGSCKHKFREAFNSSCTGRYSPRCQSFGDQLPGLSVLTHPNEGRPMHIFCVELSLKQQ